MRILGFLESLLKGVMYLLFKVHFQTSTVRSPTDPFAVLQRCAELYEALWKPTEFYRSPTEPYGAHGISTNPYRTLWSPTEPYGAPWSGALRSPTEPNEHCLTIAGSICEDKASGECEAKTESCCNIVVIVMT